MRKIILACDGPHFSEKAFDFVRQMNEEECVLVTGVFLASAAKNTLWNYASGLTGPLLVPVAEEFEHPEVADSIHHFVDLCQRNNIEYRVHQDDHEFAIRELKEESRFADVLVIASGCFYSNIKGHPNGYLLDVLQESECPVLVIPESYAYPQRVVLAYDGSSSSVFAIKQFIYLFPEWKSKPALLVYAGEGNEVPYQEAIEELASRHFGDLTIQVLPIDPVKYMSTWLENERDAIIVTGCTGRSRWSTFFGKKDFVNEILGDQQAHYLYEERLDGNCLPLFIAHR
jgi:nucleotide-binding universal stress UspA family protein